jgi:RNA polymerase sigma-70 factor (ECF subfamily)
MHPADPLEALLEKLCQGDEAAAEQVFLAYEPYLRKVVRRQVPARLRSKFDSIDVVQSVWADVLHGFRAAGWQFADTGHLRAFLVKATRNRFIDRYRQYRSAAARERSLTSAAVPAGVPSAEPRPSEIVQADELWQQMLAQCPPAHQEVLRLKRQGLSLAEIAARTNFHEDSVRRIVREVARRLSFR